MITMQKAKRTYNRTATKDYTAKAMYSRLRALVNMRKYWYSSNGVYRVEPKLLYALERVDAWLNYALNFTEENFYRKVQKEKLDIISILPSSTGKQKPVRENILDDIQFTNKYAI